MVVFRGGGGGMMEAAAVTADTDAAAVSGVGTTPSSEDSNVK